LIVVDANVLAYLCIGGEQAILAEDVLLADSDWHAPVLWRSEFRNVLAGLLRRDMLDLDRALAILAEAEILLAERDHQVPSDDVLHLVSESRCSAYDCEYVALAQRLDIVLVTNDRQLLRAFPATTQSMQTFLGRDDSADPQVDSGQ
jgi:predicted nucleic acid-binding protein